MRGASHVPYPAIGDLAVIGDRRTAAMVASDGTIVWLCLPRFDSPPVFGALLDRNRGGYWRLGPRRLVRGRQQYQADTAVLTTTWSSPEAELELTDCMVLRDQPQPGAETHHVTIRRLRCRRGRAACRMEFQPRSDFGAAPHLREDLTAVLPAVGPFRLWADLDTRADGPGAAADLVLSEGETRYAVLETGATDEAWSQERARDLLDETLQYWKRWTNRFTCHGGRRPHVMRSIITIHLLSYAPAGSPVAAPTTSLPERIGGGWNADYRFSWIRDASLCLSVLARLGDEQSARRYIDWVASRRAKEGPPLRVLYRVGDEEPLRQSERTELEGYRQSQPVRFGNHAFQQQQLDSFGFLADCLAAYLAHGGAWEPAWWPLLHSIAEFVRDRWRDPGNGIWELPEPSRFVSSRVMSWVALSRIAQVARQVGRPADADRLQPVIDEIHREVMAEGYSDRLGAFRQRYGHDSLDAATLLVPIAGFLPASHPFVVSTVERIASSLTIDGLVYRFDPESTPGLHGRLGEFEGAFVPCTLWLAHAYARMGRAEEASAILDRIEGLAGPHGLFAEGLDPRDGTWLGNTPLLLSHAAYVLAALDLPG